MDALEGPENPRQVGHSAFFSAGSFLGISFLPDTSVEFRVTDQGFPFSSEEFRNQEKLKIGY